MVFIDKTTQHSSNSKERLEVWKRAFRYQGKTLEQLYSEPNQTGGNLWDKATSIKTILRQDLWNEQNGICCYCCKKLDEHKNGKTATRIEHFLPKGEPRNVDTFRQRVFDYDNLLLSCDGDPEGSYSTTPQYVNGIIETKEEIALRVKVSVHTIDEYNDSIKIGKKVYYGKDHCDPHKANKIEPIIDPTKSRDCWEYFIVNEKGEISINSNIENDDVKIKVDNSIKILNLKATILNKERKMAFDGFVSAWEIMKDVLDIQEYFTIQHGIIQPYCFVNYHFLTNILKGNS